jgi:hypothetical protein
MQEIVGIPLTNWLLTPFPNPQTEAQHCYNAVHARGLVVIERAIGHL